MNAFPIAQSHLVVNAGQLAARRDQVELIGLLLAAAAAVKPFRGGWEAGPAGLRGKQRLNASSSCFLRVLVSLFFWRAGPNSHLVGS